jgi:hypothetical protein
MIYPQELMNLPRYLQPTIRISPCHSDSFQEILQLPDRDHSTLPSMDPKFWLDQAVALQVLRSGRSALRLALLACGLTTTDSVAIITTTGGKYVSSCVTGEIERICCWSHKIEFNTKVALIIHEFGMPCPIPADLRERGLIIIEDCAYAVGTRIEGGQVGMVGDFALYSLPKYYPFPYGGILAARKSLEPSLVAHDLPTEGAIRIVGKCLTYAETRYEDWNRRRRANWDYFSVHCEKRGCRAFFNLDTGIVPGAFVSTLRDQTKGASIKDACVNAGIESTEYYGLGGFYFPVHQLLTEFERSYVLHHFFRLD